MLAAILQHRECPPDLNDGIWYMDKLANAMILSAYRFSPDTAHRYLEALERHRPRVLVAYPSLAYLLATYAEQAGFKQKIFDVILCSSETLYDFQRKYLESVFQAPVRIHYGLIESCALFGYCEHSNVYHVELEYGVTEFLRPDGSTAGPGETGEIVATGFDNRSMPLIRFQTRDFALVGSGRCRCGRSYPLVERIEGREGDFIRAPSGKTHSPVMVEFLMDGRVGFADLQIVQGRLDQVVVKVVPGKRFTQEELDYFVRLLRERLEHEIDVVVEMVKEIPRTRRQKKSLVVSHLPGRLTRWRDDGPGAAIARTPGAGT
jgi:phenylacetate-CoA ligase